MVRRSERLVFFVFILLVFTSLTIYIGIRMYNIYSSTTGYAKTTTKTSIECNSYVYEINNINQNNGRLSFQIENTFGGKFDKLIIDLGDEKKEAELTDFTMGSKQTVEVNTTVTKFKVYPEGCQEHNVKECDVNAKTCKKL